jgi:hypothetical protein
MPAIVFVLPDGSERTATVATGTSVMLAAVRHDPPGFADTERRPTSRPGCQIAVDAAPGRRAVTVSV